MVNLFRKKCVCGKKEEKDLGITINKRWFCCESCLKEFESKQKSNKKGGCCC